MGIEPTAEGCPATGFEVQERHQAANYSRLFRFSQIDYTIYGLLVKSLLLLDCCGRLLLQGLSILLNVFQHIGNSNTHEVTNGSMVHIN